MMFVHAFGSSWKRAAALLGSGLLFLLSITAVHGRHLVRLKPQDARQRRAVFARGYRIVLSKPGDFVDVLASDGEIRQLLREGFRLETLQRDTGKIMDRIRNSPGYGDYSSYDEMVVFLKQAARRHPTLVRLFDLGPTSEALRGVCDRRILIAELTAHGAESADDRPEALFFGAIHAREIATTEMVLRTMSYLLKNYGKDGEVTRLFEDRRLWFLPMLNPDGREWAMSHDWWWRKNRSEIGTRVYGVDLNRNFAYRWGDNEPYGGSSPDPQSPVFRGEAPFSEPESRALRDFVRLRRLSVTLAFHSYGRYLLIPYGFDGRRPAERCLSHLARTVAGMLGYSYGTPQDVLGYYSCGRHDDWLLQSRADEGGPLPLEVELGDSFFPAPERLDELEAAIRPVACYLGRMAGPWLTPQVDRVRYDRMSGRVEVSGEIANDGLQTGRDVFLRLDVPGRDFEGDGPDPSWHSLYGARGSALGRGERKRFHLAGRIVPSEASDATKEEDVVVLTYGCRHFSSRNLAVELEPTMVE